MSVLVYLNLGSNVEREAHLRIGLAALRDKFGQLEMSAVYESEAVGFTGEPFYNMAVALHTDLALDALARWLRQLEYANGRQRNASRNSPRTLDIDILTFGDLCGTEHGICLPRPEILESAHVLGPLAELAPRDIHPGNGRSYGELWAEFPGQALIHPVDRSAPGAAATP